MSYTISLTDGTIFAVVADGTLNTASSVTLVGRNYDGYGDFLNENFIHLLENFSDNVAPTAPLTGQLWWDSGNGLLKVYNGTTFKTVSAATASGSAPTSNVAGDLWYDTTNAQLKVYTGTSWLLVGPGFTSGTGITGAVVDTIVDNTSVSHVVIKLYVEDNVVGIVSKDAAFTPQSVIPGFTTVRPGITLATNIGGQVPLFQGTATNSQALGGQVAADFLSAVSDDTTTGTLGILNDSGMTVGVDQDYRVSVTGPNVTIANQTSGGDIRMVINVAGNPTTVLTANGANGRISLGSALPASSGGTGAASLAANAVILGNATSAVQTVAPGTAGNVLVSSGGTWQSLNFSPSFMSAISNTSTTGTISVLNDAGMTVGATPTYRVSLTGTNAIISNQIAGGDVRVSVNVGGTPTTALTVSGSNARISLANPLVVASGGTGVATLAANAVVLGNATSAVQTVAPGTAGNVLASDGNTWTSQFPFSTLILSAGTNYQNVFGINSYNTSVPMTNNNLYITGGTGVDGVNVELFNCRVLYSGTIRIQFQSYAVRFSPLTQWIRIYKNGVAAGIQRNNPPASFTTYTEDFSVTAGDTFQLFATSFGGVFEDGEAVIGGRMRLGIASAAAWRIPYVISLPLGER